MKYFLILLYTIFYSLGFCNATPLKPIVDERFELTSIMFGLAGVPEYCQCNIPSYLQDVIDELAPYEQTEAINYVRELNQFHQIGYNVVAKTAEILEIKNGQIKLLEKYNISKISEFDPRWNSDMFAKFLTLTNDFYRQSNFHRFFKKHSELYKLAEKRTEELLSNEIDDWFISFYGKSLEWNRDLKIYVSLWNGPHNYSIPGGVVIGMRSDTEGLPAPNKDNTLRVLIHELSHHFMNPIVDRYWEQMQAAAVRLYASTKDIFSAKSAYSGERAIMCEWLTELSAIMYQYENKSPWVKFLIKRKTEEGFIWMQRSIDFMTHFYSEREKYPYFENFMPQIIDFLNYSANNVDMIMREYDTRKPYITEVYPTIGTDISNVSQIEITFSEPMLGSHGFNGAGNTGAEVLPVERVQWSDNYRKLYLILSSDMINPNCIYSAELKTEFFISSRYFSLDDNCKTLIFNTIKK